MPPSWESLFRQAIAGIVESGAMVRANSQQMWTEIRGALIDAGFVDAHGNATIGAVGRDLAVSMWSQAVARRGGYERLAKAKPSDLFATAHAAPEANVRPPDIRAVFPEYLVRFDLTYLNPAGENETRTVTLRDTWRPGMTIGDVIANVGAAAEGLGLDYGQGLVGFDNLRPVTV
jgi:hypothetical protein